MRAQVPVSALSAGARQAAGRQGGVQALRPAIRPERRACAHALPLPREPRPPPAPLVSLVRLRHAVRRPPARARQAARGQRPAQLRVRRMRSHVRDTRRPQHAHALHAHAGGGKRGEAGTGARRRGVNVIAVGLCSLGRTVSRFNSCNILLEL